MHISFGETWRVLALAELLLVSTFAGGFALASWHGVLHDDAGKPVDAATVILTSVTGDHQYRATTSAAGQFAIPDMVAGESRLSIERGGKNWGSSNSAAV